MGNLWDETNGIFEVSPGAEVTNTIHEAAERAQREGRAIVFDFNEIIVTVRADSDSALLVRDYHRALSGYTDKHIGPYPAVELTDAEKAHDAAVEAQNEARRQRSQAEYDARQRAREAAAEAKLLDAPPLDLIAPEAWRDWYDKQGDDGYGRAVFTFAERWARLMQVEIAQGARVADIADRLVSEADIEGITGFMYGCAVSALAKCWRHGEELRRWHNLKTQIRDEGVRANESGGVLNPALLNIG